MIPNSSQDDFAAFILTNGRPDNVITYRTLRRQGYTGKIYLIVDDLDKTKDEYIAKYGDEVIIFDKVAVAKTFDTGDNFDDMRAIVYARNACFKIAKDLSLKYFIQLDDDYNHFQYRFKSAGVYKPKAIRNLDKIFSALLGYFVSSGVDSVAMSQGGDWLGVEGASICFGDGLMGMHRKAMNSFICSPERPFKFVGRVNEDVNTYSNKASIGLLFHTANHISLEQAQTQATSGGMTEMYLAGGTYIKSFYSVMYHPSGVKVRMLNSKNSRLHHSVKWDNTAPLILSEDIRKLDSIAA